MAPESFVGHQVKDLVQLHNTNRPGGFSVYRLQGSDDDTGIHIADDYTVLSLLDRVPSLANAWIIQAVDYYGTFILRVYSKRRCQHD